MKNELPKSNIFLLLFVMLIILNLQNQKKGAVMYAVLFMLTSAGLLFVVDAAHRAAEEKMLERIVEEARNRARKAKDAEEAPGQ